AVACGELAVDVEGDGIGGRLLRDDVAHSLLLRRWLRLQPERALLVAYVAEVGEDADRFAHDARAELVKRLRLYAREQDRGPGDKTDDLGNLAERPADQQMCDRSLHDALPIEAVACGELAVDVERHRVSGRLLRDDVGHELPPPTSRSRRERLTQDPPWIPDCRPRPGVLRRRRCAGGCRESGPPAPRHPGC